MRSDQRRVYFYDVGIKPRSERVAHPPNSLIFDILDRAITNKQVMHYVEGKKRFLELCDTKDLDEWRAYYVKTSDQRAADASYTDFDTGDVTSHTKSKTQGRDSGAHVLISKQPSVHNGKHIMLIEKSDGMQRSYVVSLFKAIIRSARKNHPDLFSFPDASGARENGSPVLIASSLVFEVTGHPSNSFRSAINGGNLIEVELIDENPTGSPGSPGWVDEVERTATFRPSVTTIAQTNYDRLKGFVTSYGQTYERARIRFNDPESEKTETVQMISDGTVMTQRFVKSVWVADVSPPMPECCQGVHDGFIKKLLSKL